MKRSMFEKLKSSVGIALFLPLFVSRLAMAEDSRERALVAESWDIFLKHCGGFLENPGLLINDPEAHSPEGWKWVLRFSEKLEYYEYAADPSDENFHFNAVQSTKNGTEFYNCSVSLEIPFQYSENVLYQEIETYFRDVMEYNYSSGLFELRGDPKIVKRVRENIQYATDFSLKIHDIPDLQGIPVFVSAGRIGALFFETDVPSN